VRVSSAKQTKKPFRVQFRGKNERTTMGETSLGNELCTDTPESEGFIGSVGASWWNNTSKVLYKRAMGKWKRKSPGRIYSLFMSDSTPSSSHIFADHPASADYATVRRALVALCALPHRKVEVEPSETATELKIAVADSLVDTTTELLYPWFCSDRDARASILWMVSFSTKAPRTLEMPTPDGKVFFRRDDDKKWVLPGEQPGTSTLDQLRVLVMKRFHVNSDDPTSMRVSSIFHLVKGYCVKHKIDYSDFCCRVFGASPSDTQSVSPDLQKEVLKAQVCFQLQGGNIELRVKRMMGALVDRSARTAFSWFERDKLTTPSPGAIVWDEKHLYAHYPNGLVQIGENKGLWEIKQESFGNLASIRRAALSGWERHEIHWQTLLQGIQRTGGYSPFENFAAIFFSTSKPGEAQRNGLKIALSLFGDLSSDATKFTANVKRSGLVTPDGGVVDWFKGLSGACHKGDVEFRCDGQATLFIGPGPGRTLALSDREDIGSRDTKTLYHRGNGLWDITIHSKATKNLKSLRLSIIQSHQSMSITDGKTQTEGPTTLASPSPTGDGVVDEVGASVATHFKKALGLLSDKERMKYALGKLEEHNIDTGEVIREVFGDLKTARDEGDGDMLDRLLEAFNRSNGKNTLLDDRVRSAIERADSKTNSPKQNSPWDDFVADRVREILVDQLHSQPATNFSVSVFGADFRKDNEIASDDFKKGFTRMRKLLSPPDQTIGAKSLADLLTRNFVDRKGRVFSWYKGDALFPGPNDVVWREQNNSTTMWAGPGLAMMRHGCLSRLKSGSNRGTWKFVKEDTNQDGRSLQQIHDKQAIICEPKLIAFHAFLHSFVKKAHEAKVFDISQLSAFLFGTAEPGQTQNTGIHSALIFFLYVEKAHGYLPTEQNAIDLWLVVASNLLYYIYSTPGAGITTSRYTLYPWLVQTEGVHITFDPKTNSGPKMDILDGDREPVGVFFTPRKTWVVRSNTCTGELGLSDIYKHFCNQKDHTRPTKFQHIRI
jgi:hypothetical protein